MPRSGNDNLTTTRLYQRARQMAYRRLGERYPEEFAALLHDYQHEVGAPHIHRCEEHDHRLNGHAHNDGEA